MQRTFAAGEIGPTLYGGADQQRYLAALALCRNFVVMRHGGVAMRSGSQYVATVKTSSVQTYLFKFQFNDTDTYIIEAGATYFRFHQKGAPVVVSGVSAWNNATAYVAGNVVSSGGTNYICILANTNQSPPNATYWYALTGSILELPTPWAAADLPLLKYVQANNVVTFTHPSYAPQQLIRSSGNWSLVQFSTAPWASAPTPAPSVTNGGAGTLNPKYVITAQNTGTYEETTPSASVTATSSATPTATAPNVLTWGAAWSNATAYVLGNIATLGGVVYICILANTNVSPPNAAYWGVVVGFNVYLDIDGNGLYGYIGQTPNTTFNDTGFLPDASVTPPVAATLFNSSGNYPGTVAYYQQRQLFGGTTNSPETVNASRTGFFKNFTISSPIQDDDAITFGIAGRQINEVRHMVEIAGGLVVLTRTGEWIIAGDSDGVLRPTAINPHQQSYYGAANVLPVIVGSSILYVQQRGTILRDFRLEQAQQTGMGYYDGRDLTVYAPHFFEHWSITRMDFQQIPDSIHWCVRSDGKLLGMTYLRDQNVWGWHQHDTPNGIYEDVAVIPETMPRVAGSGYAAQPEDGVYVIVNRTIQGTTQRSIERFASRAWFDYRLDAIYLDCDLDYNGINAAATTVTLSTGAGWTTSDLITVTASAGTFDNTWVGLGVTIWDTANPANVNRIVITTFVDSTHVKGNPIANVQVSLQNTAQTNWSKAVANVSGLSPLAGQAVTILANGIVYTGTVSGGGTLTNIDGAGGLYDVIHVGLVPTFEIETLDLDSDQQATVRDQAKLIKNPSILVMNSRLGFQAGPDSSHLLPYGKTVGTVLSTDVFSTGQLNVLSTVLEVNITATWAKPGRVHIRQTNPLPLSILGIWPNGPLGG